MLPAWTPLRLQIILSALQFDLLEIPQKVILFSGNEPNDPCANPRSLDESDRSVNYYTDNPHGDDSNLRVGVWFRLTQDAGRRIPQEVRF